MAAKSAIGMMRNEVMDRFAALPGLVMPTQGKDPDLLHVQQLQAVIEWIDCQQQKAAGGELPIENGLTAMRSMEVGPATYERLEAFAAAVNAEGQPLLKEVEDVAAFVESVNQPIKQPAKPAPKAKRK